VVRRPLGRGERPVPVAGGGNSALSLAPERILEASELCPAQFGQPPDDLLYHPPPSLLAHSDNRMTLAICTRATEGMQDSVRATLEEAFLDPAVDTPPKRSLSSTARAIHFLAICRTFLSGGTRIRTGDTMIFSDFRRPIGMRICRIGKRIYVHGVPLDTSWFCPYC
jgi:hypothetical protein